MTRVQDDSARAETRLTVLQNSPDVGLDRFAQWLDVPLRVVRLDQGEPVPSLAEVGHGLLVLGGEMTAHSDAETPWLPAVRALLAGRSTPQITWHDDAVVDLPSGAVWLASSATYPYQAFRIGSAWGVQFHPEASPATVAAWAAERDEVDEADVVNDLAARDEQVTALARGIAQRFAELVRARADEDTCVSA